MASASGCEGETNESAAAVPPPEVASQRPQSSYDVGEYGGYEAGDAQPLPSGELSEEEQQELREEERRKAEYMEQLRGLAGEDELAEVEARNPPARRADVLESVDGMVGNYEEADALLAAKQQEVQDAEGEYQRLLEELQQLEVLAGAAGRSAAGGGSVASAEVGEGVGVEDVE